MLPRRRFLPASLSAAFFSACSTNTKKAFDGYGFIATRDSGDIAVVDLAAFALEKRIKTSAKPVQLLDLPAQSRLLSVSEAGHIDVIDPTRAEILRTASQRIHPGQLQPSFDGKLLYALSQDRQRLLALSPDSLEPIKSWQLSAPASLLSTASQAAPLAVASAGSSRISLLPSPEATKFQDADAESPISQLAFLQNGSALFVAHRAERKLTLLNASAARVMVHLPLPIEPTHYCFSPDGGQLFLTGPGLDAVVVVYPFQSQVSGTMLTGKAPGPMAATSSPSFLFVTSPQTGTVSVHDIRLQKLVAVVAVGTEPRAIAFTPDNSMAIVLNQRSGDLAIIRLANIVSKRNKTAPLFTMIPVGSAPVAAVIRSL
ncbi:MAG: YncE family protein [Bryobacter sp.]|nr:YncE family protein [Bryobacter sp.]